jgi:hypothetical protein
MTDENSLKIRKLELEIEDLRTKISWHQRILSYLPVLTIIFAICGLWYNFYQFSQAQEQQSDREAKARLDEYRKTFYEKRLNFYIEAVETASIIANNTPESTERKAAEERFIRLYSGVLHIVADESFSKAKILFYQCLKQNIPNECKSESTKQSKLQELLLDLANSAQSSILYSWKIEAEY